MNLNYLYFFGISFGICYILLIGLQKLLSKFGFNAHKNDVPCFGGIGLFFSFIVSFLIFCFLYKISLPFQLVWLCIFSFILLGIEYVDDLKNLSLRARIITQIIFIILFLLCGKKINIYFLPIWANYLLSFFWIAGITNAFNLLDISDGLCAGVSLIVCLSFLLVFVIGGDILLTVLFLTLSGAIVAFLAFNLPPAKIYLGNSGSHFIGFLFAALVMYGDYAGVANRYVLIFPLLILAFPIIDTFLLIIMRFKKGIVPLKKSDDHVFLRLLALQCTNWQALLAVYLVTFLWAGAGILVFLQLNLFAIIVLAFAVFSTLQLIFTVRRQ